ncbi:rhomboid-like protein 20 [Phalaenopsis equestris]|uniref:rhomboid-like protein 20 n=1 Tax=Phalaenopsis equestris TaxID=78828 RepID=UPI0009E46012|nr:rhomboid-like protein 20 [Phalaenopsis equestris]
MNGGPSGFQNAPVTRNLVIACAFLTVLFVARGRSASLGFSYQDITQRLRFLRIIVSTFAFSSVPELMFGLYLLYYFRLFERQIGSNKYSVFVVFSLSASLLFEVLALVFLKERTTKILASGPYGLIFASFIPFLFDIPISSRIHVFGVPFSDKSFIYLAGLQLFLSSWKRSFVPTICGLLAGSLYRLNVFGIRRIKFPQFVASFFSRFSRSDSQSSPPRVSIRRNEPTFVDQHLARSFGSTTTSIPEPPESSIAMLVSMGFDSNSARQALVRARNDINVATNILLETQTR